MGWSAHLEAGIPKPLHGVGLATAVSMALLVASHLAHDNPFWAGTSAGIVCQPVLGASLRKGVFRMVGTVVGMAFWASACSFGSTLTRNFSA